MCYRLSGEQKWLKIYRRGGREGGRKKKLASLAWLNADIMKISSYKVITCLPVVIVQIPGRQGRKQVFNYLNFSPPRLYHYPPRFETPPFASARNIPRIERSNDHHSLNLKKHTYRSCFSAESKEKNRNFPSLPFVKSWKARNFSARKWTISRSRWFTPLCRNCAGYIIEKRLGPIPRS